VAVAMTRSDLRRLDSASLQSLRTVAGFIECSRANTLGGTISLAAVRGAASILLTTSRRAVWNSSERKISAVSVRSALHRVPCRCRPA
jgi:hypothetical protein